MTPTPRPSPAHLEQAAMVALTAWVAYLVYHLAQWPELASLWDGWLR